MGRRTFRSTIAGVAAALFCVTAATLPSEAAGSPPSVTPAPAGNTVTGCGLATALPILEKPVTEGDPRAVTINKDGSRLYVARVGTGSDGGGIISVYDTDTLTEVAAMPVPGHYPYAGKVTLNPSGTKGYLPTNAMTVQVFDTTTNTMTTSIPVNQSPGAIKFNHDGTRAYVAHYNNAITVLDTLTETVIDQWEYEADYGTFSDLELDPTGTYAYVAGARMHTIYIVDLASGSIVDDIPLGGPAGKMALTGDGSTLYAMDHYNQRTVVIDMVSRTVEASFPVVGETLALSRSGNRVYIPMPNLRHIGVVDLTTNALICSHWFLPAHLASPSDVALSPDGRTMYTVHVGFSNRITALNVAEERNPSFADVPAVSFYHREISWLAAAGVTTGYDDQTFRPLEPVRRDAMAAFLYRFHGSPDFVPPVTSPFTDVRPTDKFYKEITWLVDAKISEGWPDGTYRPLEPVNRDAIAAFLYRVVDDVRFVSPAASPFADVQPDDQFYREISYLAARGVSTGWSDGTFRPLQPVNRDAMAAFLFRFNPVAAFLMR
jgi:DNA-binding beta-propeller fold protein YncE